MPTAELPNQHHRPRSSKGARATSVVLDYLDGQCGGASLSRAGTDLGMARETLRPYLQGLIEEGKVFFDSVELRYHLDPDTPQARPAAADTKAIANVLRQFTADTEHDIALAMLTYDGLRLPVYVEPRSGPALLSGLRRDSAHATASGHALLSQRPDWYLRRFFEQHGMPALTASTPTSIAALKPHLKPGPRAIWTARGQYCTEGACIAVIAHESHHRATRFALTTSVLSAEYQLKKHSLRDRLLLAAGELQTVLGPLDL